MATLASVPSQNWFTLPDNLTHDWLIPYALAAAAIRVEVGDLMYDGGSDVALPAGQMASQGSLAADQFLFASQFIGCAIDKVLASETNATRRLAVQTSGIKEFDCVSGAWSKGDLFGIYSNGSDSPVAQKVDKVLDPLRAIGVCVKSSLGVSVTTMTGMFIAKKYAGNRAAPILPAQGASTAAAGSTTSDAGVLPAGTGSVYPTSAADDTKGVRVHAADKFTGRMLFIGNGVSNKILKVYAPSGGTINGASADAAFSSASGKGVVMFCMDSATNAWLAW